jgi:TatD DNase family protein
MLDGSTLEHSCKRAHVKSTCPIAGIMPGMGEVNHSRTHDAYDDARRAEPLRWVDTHAHWDAAEFDADRDDLAQQARAAGVGMVVIPAVSAGNFDTVRELAHTHGLSYALGIHPMAVGRANERDLELLAEHVKRHRDDPRLVAVGEIGLDGFDPACVEPDAMRRQRSFFERQLHLARQVGLPVVLHVRRAVDLVLAGLRKTAVPGGIAHAFNGSHVQAHQLIERGIHLGFGGAMTFERALHLRRLAAELPLSSIVLETDAPDIAPQWLYQTQAQREQGALMRNDSAQVPRIAQTLAQLRGLSLAQVAASTTHNACAALPRLSALMIRQSVDAT